MKTFTIMLLMLGSLLPAANCQTAAKKIKKSLVTEDLVCNWKTGKTKTFFGQKITKLSTDDGLTRTNVVFWPVMGKGEMVRFVSNNEEPTFENTSGKLAIWIDREDENQANTQWYTVTISDISGEELYTSELPAQQPTHFKYGVWYNYAEIAIPLLLPEFDVIVTNRLTQETYEYRVNVSLDEMPTDVQIEPVITQR
ncbi:MAG: hypothetical protein SFW35_12520 [Chitinophagales bacterium]|nr:hypothetical protein [Chitinophagales bacterium]